jgi:hypothetical protein
MNEYGLVLFFILEKKKQQQKQKTRTRSASGRLHGIAIPFQ